MTDNSSGQRIVGCLRLDPILLWQICRYRNNGLLLFIQYPDKLMLHIYFVQIIADGSKVLGMEGAFALQKIIEHLIHITANTFLLLLNHPVLHKKILNRIVRRKA
ncbi:hypothetical protein D3C80_1726320 [compost metagenome]